MYLPIIGAFLEATGMILEKRMLKLKKFNYKNYVVYGFLGIVLIMMPFLYFIWQVETEAFKFWNLIIFLFIVFVSVLGNLFSCYALKRENISEFEPAWLMLPLFTVILAAIFYASERNIAIFILALVASITLAATHVKRHHLRFNRYMTAAVLSSLFFSIELVASKPILGYYSPFSFYFLRCLFVFAVTFLIFRPSFKAIDKKSGALIGLIAVIWVFYRVIIYYGYIFWGIVYTTVLFTLSPVLMLLFAVVFLKEKPTIRQVIANSVILICVILALVFK